MPDFIASGDVMTLSTGSVVVVAINAVLRPEEREKWQAGIAAALPPGTRLRVVDGIKSVSVLREVPNG